MSISGLPLGHGKVVVLVGPVAIRDPSQGCRDGLWRLLTLLPAASIRETHYIYLPSLIDSNDNMILRGLVPL